MSSLIGIVALAILYGLAYEYPLPMAILLIGGLFVWFVILPIVAYFQTKWSKTISLPYHDGRTYYD